MSIGKEMISFILVYCPSRFPRASCVLRGRLGLYAGTEDAYKGQYLSLYNNYPKLSTVSPQLKPWGLINFMVHNHPGSNQKRGEIETIDLLNLLIWMGKLAGV